MQKKNRFADNFLLIGEPHSSWSSSLQNALTPLGPLEMFSEQEVSAEILAKQYTLIIIDATVVKEPVLLVTSIRGQNPNARIVVATWVPTWKRAREILQAGALDYISKSANEQELLSAIKGILRSSIPNSINPQTKREEE